jgi:putative spermidine/putrescine transport system ATP-binding protein
MVAISIEALRKRYDNTVALDDVSLEIERGQFVTFLGPSGCGKTTTMRIVAGFVAADSGRVLFDGRDITRIPPQHRNVGMVHQGYALFPHMSVEQNVAFGLEMRKIPAREIAQRVAEVIALVRMEQHAKRLPRQLSGGQQLRVALARAVVMNPDVLLLDEPLSALDARLRVDIRREIRAVQRKLGLTTIFVTHDQEEALSTSDRIVVMNAGRVEQVGSPREIYEQPASRFVADFIGGSNILDGAMMADRFVTAFGANLVPPSADTADASALAIRPESIVLGKGPAPEGWNRVAGTIESAEYLGSTLVVSLRVAEDRTMVARLAVERQGEPPTWLAGDAAELQWPHEAGSLLAR